MRFSKAYTAGHFICQGTRGFVVMHALLSQPIVKGCKLRIILPGRLRCQKHILLEKTLSGFMYVQSLLIPVGILLFLGNKTKEAPKISYSGEASMKAKVKQLLLFLLERIS